MNGNVEFRVMEEADVEDILLLLARSFCAYDPIEVVLGITEPEFIEMTRLDIPQILEDGLSMVAWHTGTNERIGVTLALDATTPFTDSTGKITPKFAPVAAIVNQLHHPYQEKLSQVRGYAAYYYMGAVQGSWQGRGVAQQMFKATENLIVSKGYECLFGIVTSRGSQAALEKNGFHCVASNTYRGFIYQGKKPFSSIRKHPGLSLMEKHLGQAEGI